MNLYYHLYLNGNLVKHSGFQPTFPPTSSRKTLRGPLGGLDDNGCTTSKGSFVHLWRSLPTEAPSVGRFFWGGPGCSFYWLKPPINGLQQWVTGVISPRKLRFGTGKTWGFGVHMTYRFRLGDFLGFRVNLQVSFFGCKPYQK